MRVEVKVLDDEWTSAPAIFKDLGRCLTLPAALRCRVQQDAAGHRGCRGDPLYQIRLLLRALSDRLTKRQQERLREAFTADEAHN